MKPKRLLNIIRLSLFALLAHSPLAAQTQQSLRTAEFSSGGEVDTNFVAILGQPSPVDLIATSGDTLASGVLPTYFYPTTFSLRTSVPFATRARAGDYQSHEYRLIGLPGESKRLVSEFLLSGKQGEAWQVYRDNGQASNFFVKFDGSADFKFSVGRGFWIIQKGPLTINTFVPAAPVDTSEVAKIPLQPEWNIITNPYSCADYVV